MTDVLIAGAGVAGSSLAIALGRLGYRVRLFDKARFPRDKVCGEGLMPAGVTALARFGLKPGGAPFEGIRYHLARLTAQARFSQGTGLAVRRIDLDAALLEEASRHADVREGARVEMAAVESGRVAGLVVDGELHRARLTVGADGVHSMLRHKLGIPVVEGRRRFALRVHYRAHWEPMVDVYWGDRHEVYVTPLPDGLVSVALLAQPGLFRGAAGQVMSHAIRLHPELQHSLGEAEQIDHASGAASWNLTPRVRHLPGLLLHGDAAGYIDPITGGGMTQALIASNMIADHLRAGIPDDLAVLDQARQRLLLGYRLLTRAALWLAGRRPAALASLQLLRSCPGLFAQLLSVAGSAR